MTLLKKRVLTTLFFLCVTYLLIGCDAEPKSYHFSGSTMGTTYNVTLVGSFEKKDLQELRTGIDNTLQSINNKMSTYDPNSEVSLFNAAPVDQWFMLSKETTEVIALAQEVNSATAGAFDITLGKVVAQWGFGPNVTTLSDEARSTESLSTESSISESPQRIGHHLFILEPDRNRIKKLAAISLDLSAIAKGYGVDQVAEYLLAQSLSDFIVEVGGELRTSGKSHRGDAWRIAVERPVAQGRVPQRVMRLPQHAVATSGDYRNFYEKDGVRYSHTIDPVTMEPVTHKLASVTVVGESSARTDAFATGLTVLGPERGYQLAEKLGLSAYFIIRHQDGFTEKYTEPFRRLIE